MRAIKRILLAGAAVTGLTGLALADAAPDGVRGNVTCFGGPSYVCQEGRVFTQAPAFAWFETESNLGDNALASAAIVQDDDDEEAFASATIEDEDGAGSELMRGAEQEDD
jgi:hypothetical protein